MASAQSPLSHLTVLDMSRVMAGPWATQILADLGATVIKVEQPGKGDETRRWGPPFLESSPSQPQDSSAYFLSANRGKKSVTIDFKSERGREIIRKLASKCDCLIENFKVGTLDRFGLGYEDLKKVNPRLIYCSITGFGQTGPYRERPGFDYIIQGMGGLMSITGSPEGEPMRVGVPIADLMTGMYVVVAVMGALIARDKEMTGQYIDMALFDVQAAMLSNQAMNALLSGQAPGRIGNTHPNIVPYQVFETRNGPFILAIGNDQQFGAFCRLTDNEALLNSRFARNEDRVRHREELAAIIQKTLLKLDRETWLKRLHAEGIPCGPIQDIQETLSDPQLQSRGIKVDLRHPSGKSVPYLRSPINYSQSSLSYDLPAPELGDHTADVLKAFLGIQEHEIENLKKGRVI